MTAFVQFAICNLQFAICIMVIFLNGCAPPTVAALPVTPTAPRPPAKKVARPVEAIDRVLIISIDGLRPDLALRAYMPRVRALCASGSYTFWAETAAEAYTLPCHVSMLTGVSSDKHGVTWNDYIEEAWPNSPTLFELAHEAGYTTALVTGKMKFITLLKPMEGSQGSGFRVQEESLAPPKRPGEGSGDAERVQGSPARIGFRLQDDANAGSPPPSDEAIQNPKSKIQNPEPLTPNPQPLLFQRPTFRDSNTVDHYFLPSTEPISDHDVATEAVRVMRDHRPEVFFVHFPGVDTVGHERGWGTPEQITAIEQADAAVGRVLDALAELDLTNATLIILTADHGGAGLDHRAGDPRCHFIPWIISGPGIRQDFDLTLTERPIHIEDTFATACAFLSVACETACDGTPLVEALKKREPVSLPTEN
jgi:arylsulfatase A-like enzyme